MLSLLIWKHCYLHFSFLRIIENFTSSGWHVELDLLCSWLNDKSSWLWISSCLICLGYCLAINTIFGILLLCSIHSGVWADPAFWSSSFTKACSILQGACELPLSFTARSWSVRIILHVRCIPLSYVIFFFSQLINYKVWTQS